MGEGSLARDKRVIRKGGAEPTPAFKTQTDRPLLKHKLKNHLFCIRWLIVLAPSWDRAAALRNDAITPSEWEH